ncbi:exoribonuclease II [Edwardsiella anguillarum]|nr:exoribonuclease II [Edwardsiella anguillarum]
MGCRPARGLDRAFKQGDWVLAEMRRHPLKGDRSFFAEITAFITDGGDHFALVGDPDPPRSGAQRAAVAGGSPAGRGLEREDLCALPFVTIDSASTEDMDDALHVRENADGSLRLTIAIADPTAYVSADSPLDAEARHRAFTTYLPGFNIPMLPRDLSDDLCSLRGAAPSGAGLRGYPRRRRRPARRHPLLLRLDRVQAKLVYDRVSDWLEGCGDWQPPSDAIAAQIRLLHRVANARTQWRQRHALVFRDRPDYRFVLDDHGDVTDIVAEPRRVANRIVEECMITANVCAALVLRERLGFGIYNVHTGFDPALVEQAVSLLNANDVAANAEALLTLDGFCTLRRHLDSLPSTFLDSRIRRFQTFAEISTEPGPHFGLGLEAYATWTSPIRKYGDMVNHRLLKALIAGKPATRPDSAMTLQLAERRRQNRMAERDVGDWLYARFLKDKVNAPTPFNAEIIDISRGGMRVRLLENGAVAFIPASFIHAVRDEMVCSGERHPSGERQRRLPPGRYYPGDPERGTSRYPQPDRPPLQRLMPKALARPRGPVLGDLLTPNGPFVPSPAATRSNIVITVIVLHALIYVSLTPPTGRTGASHESYSVA